ncbi:MAG: methyltransferase domain-containing protein [Alphaproteobacteria bacterium]|nr:methyltransferase domain-containing protein [Alphaproteobacteria bacterium]
MAPNDRLVFDRPALRAHRRRARAGQSEDFLFREVAARLAERLLDIQRTFPVTAELGARGPLVHDALRESGALAARQITTYVATAADPPPANHAPLVVQADDEVLPWAPGRLDLILSNLALHWVNDLPGTLVQVRRALRPDGLFLAALLGGDTMHELRQSLLAAELEVEGGVSPRVSPFVDVRDAGSLLQRAGFALPVSDIDTLTVTYGDPLALFVDLRRMGETNAVFERKRNFLRRTTLQRTIETYRSRFAGADGRIRATFQVIYLTGWAPDESQQKPLRPGSARVRLADALGTTERSAGEKAGPR